ncbi:carboxypeptidase C prc1 [Mortierella polycephala]|uniref:Carboxypeptidase C prc1 n=1 Tax=Mortierella polycephala TaxID=41804 RepID=A0A9P6QIJ5_9FUNG|nr:carboxypeptidase C prc1 [Mortierella polycephala]
MDSNPSTTTSAPTTVALTESTPSSGLLTLVPSGSRTVCLTPEPFKALDNDQDAIWQVLADLDRFAGEARKDRLLLAAEIEDLMSTIDEHCQQLGLDPTNACQLLILPFTATISLTTRQALYWACDDLYQDIVRRKQKIEIWVSRIITIAENIRETPEVYLETNMPPMSKARILQLERTYRVLEREWMERLQRFQSMVGMLRVRWDQCAYLPLDDYDHALNKLFALAEMQDSAAQNSYFRIEAPLCLSKECLTSLSTKLANLDQNFYTRQSRIRAMEHVLGLIYQDLKTSADKRVIFRNEATVKYAAELGRELKGLQLELTARKLFLSGERWAALHTVWDSCLIGEQQRENFKRMIDDVASYVEKLKQIQSEIDLCDRQFSRSGAVYKLMMTRSNHIEKMIAFEHTARDPKRLFQSSFQLMEEDKFRRRAYPTLLKLENTLLGSIKKYEMDHGEDFMYEGAPYIETLQTEIDHRHVNETVFAKFTPVIAAPTRSQTTQIMGRPVSPILATSTPAATPRPSQPLRRPTSTVRPENTRRSITLPSQLSASVESSFNQYKGPQPTSADKEDNQPPTLRSLLLSHQENTYSTSTSSLGSLQSLQSKLSPSCFSVASTSTTTSTCTSTTSSPATDVISNSGTSYFGQMSSSTATLVTASSSLSLNSDPTNPKQEQRSVQSNGIKTPPGSPVRLVGPKTSQAHPQISPGRRIVL